MRNKAFSRILALVLAACVSFAGTFAASAFPAEAKAKAKLSAKSVTIAMGGTQKITLKNAKKGKWSIQGNGVAAIKKKTKKYVVIKPLKAGTATLTCKAGKKKLTCKVRVLNNKVGKPPSLDNPDHFVVIVGKSETLNKLLDDGDTVASVSYNTKKAKITASVDTSEPGYTVGCIKIKALKPGKVKLRVTYNKADGSQETDQLSLIFINGFRGKSKASKNSRAYKKWRRETISTMASADMTTWEMIDALGTLIASGKYSSKGGATGMQLWYGGNGTCISGAKMMKDFMNDLGISAKIHFMGKSKNSTDIYGYSIIYGSQHKNVWIKLGGKRYELNPQPGMAWPIGIVKRK